MFVILGDVEVNALLESYVLIVPASGKSYLPTSSDAVPFDTGTLASMFPELLTRSALTVLLGRLVILIISLVVA